MTSGGSRGKLWGDSSGGGLPRRATRSVARAARRCPRGESRGRSKSFGVNHGGPHGRCHETPGAACVGPSQRAPRREIDNGQARDGTDGDGALRAIDRRRVSARDRHQPRGGWSRRCGGGRLKSSNRDDGAGVHGHVQVEAERLVPQEMAARFLARHVGDVDPRGARRSACCRSMKHALRGGRPAAPSTIHVKHTTERTWSSLRAGSWPEMRHAGHSRR